MDIEEEEPAGVPEWVVTYGDMMSLLLTFFIMLVSLSEVVAEQKYRAVLTALDKRVGLTTSPVSPPGQNFAANSDVYDENDKLGAQSPEDGRGGVRTKSVKGDDRRIKVTNEGTPQQVGSFIEFIAGTTNLTAESEDELQDIVNELRGKPNKIEIRSHVARAFDEDPSDPESEIDAIARSYDQGHIVYKLLYDWGINPDRIRITAAGAAPSNGDGQGLKAQQERVEVYITDVFSSEYVGGQSL